MSVRLSLFLMVMTVVPILAEEVQVASPTATIAAEVSISTAADQPSPILRRFIGTVESIDVPGQAIVVKGRDGMSSRFTVGAHSRIDRHHRRIELRAVKPGERVMIRYREGTTEVRVLKIWSKISDP